MRQPTSLKYKQHYRELCDLKVCSMQQKNLHLINGILFRKFRKDSTEYNGQIVPVSLKKFEIEQLHDKGGHLGILRTFKKIQRNYYWSKQKDEFKNYCKSCLKCQKSNHHTHPSKEELININLNHTLEKVAIDLIGPLSTSYKENRYSNHD